MGCAALLAAGLAWELDAADGCALPGAGRPAPLLRTPPIPLGLALPDESDVDVVDGAFDWDFFPSTLDLISSFTFDSFWPIVGRQRCNKRYNYDRGSSTASSAEI